jgi:hypothetical protein
MARKTTASDPEPQRPPPAEDLPGEPDVKSNGPIPSSEPGDLVDPTRFADDDDDPVRSDIRRVRCSLNRPDNFTRFRTWPDRDWWRVYHFLIRERAGQNATHFLVDRSLLELDELEGRTKRKRLVPYVTKAGALGLWPMGVDETNPYVETALYICEKARTEWVCAVTRGREDKEYHCKDQNPDKVYGEPQWPPHLTLNALVSLAFPRDRQILTPNHPELVRLREDD